MESKSGLAERMVNIGARYLTDMFSYPSDFHLQMCKLGAENAGQLEVALAGRPLQNYTEYM